MRDDKGHTLLETLLALLLALVVLGAFLGATDSIQRWSIDLTQILERDRNAALAALLLTRWVYPAGNNHWTGTWPGCSLESGALRVRSDMDGTGGFPDLDLDESYEDIAIRQAGADLQLRSGAGNFQPVLKNISGFAANPALPLVRLRLEAQTDQRLRSLGAPARTGFELSLYLWNHHANLFREAP